MTSHRTLQGAAKPLTLIREGIAITRSALGPSITLAVIVAGLCLAVFATAGRAAAAERSVGDRIDDAGTRLITVQYTAPTGALDASLVGRVAALSQVLWAVGLGPASDAGNAALDGGGDAVPARTVFGQPPDELVVVAGRWPHSGEAVVTAGSQRAVGLMQPAGAILFRATAIPVVGLIHPAGLLTALAPYILVAPATDDTDVTTLYALVDRAANIAAARDSIRQLLGVDNSGQVDVSSSSVLAELGVAISGELGSTQRALSAGVLAAGILIIALSTYAAVAARKRDFGRRRALGASRGAIVGLVLVQVCIPAVGGAIVGTVAGWIITNILGASPGWQFNFAVPVLAICAAVVAVVPVSYIAARRDPVRILRVP